MWLSFNICIVLTVLVQCPLSSASLESSSTIPRDLRPRALVALRAEHLRDVPGTASEPCDSHKPAEAETISETSCPPSKFRAPTGECNNVRHRDWAARGDTFLRLLPAAYADGMSSPRVSLTSHALPGPQQMSLLFSNAHVKDHSHVTALMPAWGQLLQLDLAQTLDQDDDIICCKNVTVPIECYSRVEGQCIQYTRTVPSRAIGDCGFDRREQMNTASGFLDASDLYGSTEHALRSIRSYEGGKVDLDSCQRCKDHTALGVLYTALFGEHNRLTTVFARLNPHWDDSRLFLEARRAVTAQIQHITFKEFLPIVLGELSVSKDDLRLLASGHYSGYSSMNRAGVFNEVAMAALSAFKMMIPSYLENDSLTMEALLSTPAKQPSFAMITRDDSNIGLNAAFLLVHKAREHGIPAYRNALNLCSARAGADASWDDLEEAGLSKNARSVLEQVYMHPGDVDLIVGALLEKPVEGAIFGPTISCLLQLQFSKLRNSDRFWYENDLPPSSLTPDQIKAIRTVTLSGLLCAQRGPRAKVQPRAFVKPDPFLNAGLVCDQLPHLEISAWLDEDHMDLEEVPAEVLMEAVERAKDDLVRRRKMEYEAWANNGGVDPKSPSGTAASFSKANRNALLLANSSLLFEMASNEILNSLHHRRRKRQAFDNQLNVGFSRDDFTDTLQSVDVSSFLGNNSPQLENQCEDFSVTCDTSTPFRTLTGHCNNLRNPSLGKSLTTFARLLPATYEDGVSRPRMTGVTGAPLPNPRVVSTLIHPDISNLHSRYSLMTMQFAQFLDHDLTMTPIHKGFHESIPNCRSCDSPRTVHPECNPFPVPPGDHYYPEINVTSGERMCFPSMRSLPGQQHLGPREQVNQNTHFLDGSQIYGENGCVARDLRGFAGRLNSTIHPIRGKELLPQSPHHPECKAPSGYCFIAGDGRASEQPGLTVIHTIFMREHNRVVEGLRGVNPHWNGDQLYEHARRIVIAQNQHITYNEFLPRILSWNAVNLYGLKLLPQGYYKDYSASCNPNVVTEFGAAAFRIGHSLLRPHIPRMNANHQTVEPPVLLRDGFFKPDMILQPLMIDEMSRGMVATPMETLDQFITGEVTNHLFEDRKIPFSGVDLVALNVQRARDHGIPGYNNYRALCNLKRANNWDDLSREMPPEVISRLKRIYATVDDIDLFPGGMSERPLQGGLVGPTFACIIAIQFRQLRKCDRFWYENEDPTIRFSEPQLAELRKTTLSKIICENLDIQGEMQRAAFDLPSNFLNPRVPCHSMGQIDLSAWREGGSNACQIGGRTIGLGDSAFPSPCTSCICTSEGAQCASLRITDCNQLAREWPREMILRDDVCSAQCGLVLANPSRGASLVSSFRSTVDGLVPPPPRQARSRPSFHFQGFKLPDLSSFVG